MSNMRSPPTRTVRLECNHLSLRGWPISNPANLAELGKHQATNQYVQRRLNYNFLNPGRSIMKSFLSAIAMTVGLVRNSGIGAGGRPDRAMAVRCALRGSNRRFCLHHAKRMAAQHVE